MLLRICRWCAACIPLLVSFAAPLSAQPVSGKTPANVVWQYGVLTIERSDRAHVFTGPDGHRVESKGPRQFLLRLAEDSTLQTPVVRDHAGMQAAALQILGRKRWELVGCEFVWWEYGGAPVTVCHLKRPEITEGR